MGYKVLVHKKAQSSLGQLQPKIRKNIKDGLRQLENDPFTKRPNADIKKLSGTKAREDAYRLRVGDYRIVYAVEKKTAYVTMIFHRGKDYQEL